MGTYGRSTDHGNESAQKFGLQFGSGNHTLVLFAKPTVAVTRDKIVYDISYGLWNPFK